METKTWRCHRCGKEIDATGLGLYSGLNFVPIGICPTSGWHYDIDYNWHCCPNCKFIPPGVIAPFIEGKRDGLKPHCPGLAGSNPASPSKERKRK